MEMFVLNIYIISTGSILHKNNPTANALSFNNLAKTNPLPNKNTASIIENH